MEDWQPIETAPEGVEVMTKIEDEKGARNEQSLVKVTREPGKTRPLWFFPDLTVYVYYTPTHWKPL
ncbi:hypothetical protein [Neotabrizicola sp. sgz301269]|uniref:hypothetical protein n=1 Tax=Neotabrizicola sp. sgz301269 TaxID=3276282 RepID=UPI00376FDC31